MRLLVGLAAYVAAIAAARASGSYAEVIGEEGSPPPRWHLKPPNPAATPIDAERESNDYMKWRYKFIMASDKRLGSAKDISAIEREIQSTDATLRWLSSSVVLAYTPRSFYVVEKHRSTWSVAHRYFLHP